MAMLGERSTRNERDYQVAWQAAEAALMDAQFDIRGPERLAGGADRALHAGQHERLPARLQHDRRASAACASRRSKASRCGRSVDFLDDSGTPDRRVRHLHRAHLRLRRHRRQAGALPRYMIESVRDSTPMGSAASRIQADHVPHHVDGLRPARGRAGRAADRVQEGMNDATAMTQRCASPCARRPARPAGAIVLAARPSSALPSATRRRRSSRRSRSPPSRCTHAARAPSRR